MDPIGPKSSGIALFLPVNISNYTPILPSPSGRSCNEAFEPGAADRQVADALCAHVFDGLIIDYSIPQSIFNSFTTRKPGVGWESKKKLQKEREITPFLK